MEKVFVCDEDEVLATGRKQVTVNSRDIFIIHRDGHYFALDSFCYHAGGPLYQGNIEDYGGKTCVTCPWHRYRISISTGEGFYESINPFDLSKPSVIKSKGMKQRTHQVIIENKKVYVQLSTSNKLDSDYYNDKESRKHMELT